MFEQAVARRLLNFLSISFSSHTFLLLNVTAYFFVSTILWMNERTSFWSVCVCVVVVVST